MQFSISLRYAVSRVLPVFDFIGDVAVYVARSRRREHHVAALANIVEVACVRAPSARIVLVGHSLGSVLAAQAALRVKDGARKRIILITLASPLRFLSRVFPRDIPSSNQIERECKVSTVVDFWINLWRDGDLIGAAVAPDEQAVFAETSLGDGPHWNMWEDERLWRIVISLLHVRGSDDLSSLRSRWLSEWSAEVRLPGQEMPEVYWKGRILLLRRWLAMIVVFILIPPLQWRTPIAEWIVGTLATRSENLLRAFCAFAEIVCLALFVASLAPPDPIGKPINRSYVAALRRRTAASDVLYSLTEISLLLVVIVLLWLRYGHAV